MKNRIVFLFACLAFSGSLYSQSFQGKLAVGSFHNCAIVDGGKVVCWGLGDTGQIGNGKLVNALTPQYVSGITNAKQLAAGEHWTCALLEDASVKCWGFISAPWTTTQDKSKVRPCKWGSHESPCTPLPVSVPPARGISSISGMATMTYGFLPDGKVVVWTGEEGTANILKDGKDQQIQKKSSMIIDWIPEPVEISTIYAATHDMPATFCAVTRKGRVYCYNADLNLFGPRKPICEKKEEKKQSSCDVQFQGKTFRVSGEDGEKMCKHRSMLDESMMKSYQWYCAGNQCTYKPVPQAEATHLWYLIMPDGDKVKSAITGYAEIVSKNGESEIVCRSDFYTVELESSPVEGVENVSHVTLYNNSAFAITKSGEVYYWGEGRTENDVLPGAVPSATGKPMAPVRLDSFRGAVTIRHMSWSGCALFADGRVKCWGVAGDEGRLGDGIFREDETTRDPVTVKGITDASYLGMGHSHACVVQKDGRVFCWGLNDNGQLGNGQNKNSASPVEVKGVRLSP